MVWKQGPLHGVISRKSKISTWKQSGLPGEWQYEKSFTIVYTDAEDQNSISMLYYGCMSQGDFTF